MRPVPKRLDAVKRQARRATPHHNVAMLEPNAARPIVAPQTTEQEHRRKPQRHRNNRLVQSPLVAILMQ